MSDILILVLAAFDRYNQLSEDDIIALSGCTERSLGMLVADGILIRDTERNPRTFYRLTFFGTLAAADAKRRMIMENRSNDTEAMISAKGTARRGLPIPPTQETTGKHLINGGLSRAERMRRQTLAEDIARLHPDLALPKTRRGWKR